ncbi:MAG: DUF1501 domain-containing protein [Planctomycetia bacterium]|nr:DUF1501 domain-containing protein [Planctomycetia bacterium]
MLSVLGPARWSSRGLIRREFLRFGSLAALGSPLAGAVAHTSRGDEPSTKSFGRAKRCMVLFLTGGPPQHDTWDPKPAAPAQIRGETTPIATAIPGVQFGHWFPRIARVTDRLCVLRSVTHTDTVHTSAGYTMLTGFDHPLANTSTAANIRPLPNDHPHVGSIVSRARQPAAHTPIFAALPEIIKDAAVNEFPGQGGGFLGKRYDPFRISADSKAATFSTPDIALPDGITVSRLGERRRLIDQLEGALRRGEGAGPLCDYSDFQAQAFGLVQSPAVRQAFEVDREPEALRRAYGTHLFGQGALLGRRLLEAGVTFVTVYWHYEGPDDSPVWDTHWNNFQHLRERLAAPTDQAVAALIADLDGRGLLADTLVLVFGEFGRTPKVNGKAGRDHWPHVQSILLAGAGVPAGTVLGASDRDGAYPAEMAVAPRDLVATILHLLGVPGRMELRDLEGRAFPACEGVAIGPLLG